MERDLTPRDEGLGPPDDAELGALVRAVAEDWRRPPQRLDQPSWRDRVDAGRRSSNGSGGRRWIGRLTEAGILAVVATVILAIGAVFLTSPSRNGVVGSIPSTDPTGHPSPTGPDRTPSAVPTGSAMPGLVVNGTLPTVTTVLLQAGDGHRVADLKTGTIGPSLPGDGTSLARPGGGWVCVCSTFTPGKGGRGSDELFITLQAIAPDGSAAGSAPVRTLLSRIDPSQPLTSDSTGVNIQASSSPDGRYGFIGWSERSTTGWHAGVDVVDLATLEVVDRQALPDPVLPDAAKGRTWVLLAPFVDMVAGSGAVLVTENWFVDDNSVSNPAQGTFHLSTTFGGGAMADPVSAGTRVDAGCFEWEHGVIDERSFYVACIRNDSGGVRVERFLMDGTAIDQADVGQFTGYGAFAARPDHRLFLWDPQSHTLMRYDLQTGSTSSLTVPATAGTQDPLDPASMVGRAIGSWIAPTATAKVYLQPAMVVSPDGTRLYAIGIEGTPAEVGGSAGVFAFDISGDQIALAGHWPPNADYISLALSADGDFVYAAGMSGVDPQGVMAPDVQSSITVFDASDGSVRLVAGELGAETSILFTSPLIH